MQESAEIVEQVLAGDIRTISRVLTAVENQTEGWVTELLKQLFPLTGSACIIGLTGSPGCGKSSLVEHLAHRCKDRGSKVGILAIDPTSPFSGGAILGDRIRMQSLATQRDVFIRSMATRGQMGGLSAAVNDALLVLDAAGYKILIVETVGVGQDEVDIVKTADITVVVLVPGMGDDIQTIKAGIMEIGDIFVINKADKTGRNRIKEEVQALLSLAGPRNGWTPPIIETVATEAKGIEELIAAIQDYRDTVICPGRGRTQELHFHRQRLVEMLRNRLTLTVAEQFSEEELNRYAEKVMLRELDPYSVVDELVQRVKSSPAKIERSEERGND
jgi:LAO/AO transport system kinase